MNLTGRLFIACALVVATKLVVIAVHSGTDPEPAPLPQVGPHTLPQSVADYVGKDEPVDVRTLTVSNADAMLNRAYTNRLGDKVIVNVGIWVNCGRGIPHPPDLCYPSAGWEIVSRNPTSIGTGSGHSFAAKRYLFQRNENRAAVMMWAHYGDAVVFQSEQIRPILQRLRGTGEQMPAIVKVMLHTDAVDVEQAQARLTRFAAELFPYTKAIR